MGQQSLAQQSPKGPAAQPRKAATAPKKIEPADFSALTAFKDALLDLKGAVKVGVNRLDYAHKLQTASGEELKAEDRLREDNKPELVRHRFICYQIAFNMYRIAAAKWDRLLVERRYLDLPGAFDLPGTEDRISKIESELQTSWDDAARELDTCNTSGSPNLGATLPKSASDTAPAPPAAKPVSRVDSVIDLVNSGMSESLIIKSLQAQPFVLAPADLVRLQKAGVSANIINVMMDSKATPAPAAAAAPGPR